MQRKTKKKKKMLNYILSREKGEDGSPFKRVLLLSHWTHFISILGRIFSTERNYSELLEPDGVYLQVIRFIHC